MKVTITLEVENEVESVIYAIRQTTAPPDFDGFGTFTFLDVGDYRLVLIREEHLRWQAGRYGSGLHSCESVEFPPAAVLQPLWERIKGQAPQ